MLDPGVRFLLHTTRCATVAVDGSWLEPVGVLVFTHSNTSLQLEHTQDDNLIVQSNFRYLTIVPIKASSFIF